MLPWLSISTNCICLETTRRLPCPIHAGILDRVFQVDERADFLAHIGFIDQHRTPFQQIAVTLDHEIDGGLPAADDQGR